MGSWWLLQLLVIAASPGLGDLSSRIVRTQYGELSGIIVSLGGSSGPNGNNNNNRLENVEVFKGVPYASPPVGSLRFMPPVSSARWHGVRVADKFGPVCPQRLPKLTDKMPRGRLDYLRRLMPYLQNQSEDCLYLNIYAPLQGKQRNFLINSASFRIPKSSESVIVTRGRNSSFFREVKAFAFLLW